jgi:hypothetical protein
VELVFPILHFAEIQQPVVSGTLIVWPINHMHAPMVDVYNNRANASMMVLLQLILDQVSGTLAREPVKTQTVVVLQVKSCVLMVNVSPKIAHLLVRLLPLVPLEHTDGGMEVATILPVVTIQ